MSAHGSASAYQAGCRCPDCRQAHRDRLRAYRAGKLGVVAAEPAAPLPADGVVAAVTRTVAGVGVDREAEVAVALTLAAILDDPKAPAGSKPAAARSLLELLTKLRGRSSRPRRIGGVA